MFGLPAVADSQLGAKNSLEEDCSLELTTAVPRLGKKQISDLRAISYELPNYFSRKLRRTSAKFYKLVCSHLHEKEIADRLTNFGLRVISQLTFFQSNTHLSYSLVIQQLLVASTLRRLWLRSHRIFGSQSSSTAGSMQRHRY